MATTNSEKMKAVVATIFGSKAAETFKVNDYNEMLGFFEYENSIAGTQFEALGKSGYAPSLIASTGAGKLSIHLKPFTKRGRGRGTS